MRIICLSLALELVLLFCPAQESLAQPSYTAIELPRTYVDPADGARQWDMRYVGLTADGRACGDLVPTSAIEPLIFCYSEATGVVSYGNDPYPSHGINLLAVSDSGALTGSISTDATLEGSRAFVTSGGAVVELGLIRPDQPTDDHIGRAVADNRVVAGMGASWGVIWVTDSPTSMTSLDPPQVGGPDFVIHRVAGMNNLGTVVGWGIPPSGENMQEIGFTYSAGTMTPLAPLDDGLKTKATAVNNLDQVVALSKKWESSQYLYTTFVWRAGAVETQIETGADMFYPIDINDSGWIVGWSSEDETSNIGTLLLWSDGVLYDATELGLAELNLWRPLALNEAGQILTGRHLLSLMNGVDVVVSVQEMPFASADGGATTSDASAEDGGAPVVYNQVRYLVTVANQGSAEATDVELVVTLPDGASYLSEAQAVPHLCEPSATARQVDCSLGDLPPGEQLQLGFRFGIGESGSYTATATASTSAEESSTDNNEASLAVQGHYREGEEGADLSVSISSDDVDDEGDSRKSNEWEDIQVSVSATNHGPEWAANPTVEMEVPSPALLYKHYGNTEGWDLIEHSPQRWEFAKRAPFGVGEAFSATVDMRTAYTGETHCTVTISSETYDPDESNNRDQLVWFPPLGSCGESRCADCGSSSGYSASLLLMLALVRRRKQ